MCHFLLALQLFCSMLTDYSLEINKCRELNGYLIIIRLSSRDVYLISSSSSCCSNFSFLFLSFFCCTNCGVCTCLYSCLCETLKRVKYVWIERHRMTCSKVCGHPTLVPICSSTPNWCHKTGSSHLSKMAVYADTLQFAFSRTKEPKAVSARQSYKVSFVKMWPAQSPNLNLTEHLGDKLEYWLHIGTLTHDLWINKHRFPQLEFKSQSQACGKPFQNM